MRTPFLVWVASCLMVTGASEATAQSSFTPTQAQTAGTSNALDVQDRIRARELEVARADVRRRLGDRSPEPTIRDEDFTAPNTNAHSLSNPNQKP
jgi:hypothetical protein